MLALIGLANVGGSLGVGLLAARFRFKTLLVGINLLRALAIAAYLAAPHTPGVLLAFAVVLGLTWLSTVPPTAGLIAKRQGTARLATLFGLTLVTHQVGAFLGAWLGGIAFESGGDYHWMWRADLLLALLAAAVNLPIREAAPLRAAQPAAA
jgi:predicted MFS family arabinose efflux permease